MLLFMNIFYYKAIAHIKNKKAKILNILSMINKLIFFMKQVPGNFLELFLYINFPLL